MTDSIVQHKTRQPVDVRFWSKVLKTDGCWTWTGATSHYGYGLFNLRRRGKASCCPAHIVSYELTNSPVPEGLCVLHKCDNRPCVRPDHLYLGTKHDNNMDMVSRNRTSSHLTPEQVIEIRSLYASSAMGYRKLAAHFGLSRSGVRQIILGQRWVHL